MKLLKEELETDNQGNMLSPIQEIFFKNSKIRDKKGHLLVCYHGTPNPGFTEFDPRKAKSQFGNYKFDKYNVNYFTTNLEIAKGYTEIGVGDVDDKYKNIYAVYLNIKNPYIVDNHTTAEIKSFKNIKDKKIREVELRGYREFFSKWHIEDAWIGDFADELNRDLRKFNKAVRPNEDNNNYYDLVELETNTLYGKEHPVMRQYERVEDLVNDDSFKENMIGSDEFEDDYNYSIDYIIG